jgi:hypothetical protein
MVGVAKMRKGERRIVLVEGVAGGCGAHRGSVVGC